MPTKHGLKVDRFYHSKQWKEARQLCIVRSKGRCHICGKSYATGMIVHHIHELNENNVSNPLISLSQNNLELLCKSCHKQLHAQLDQEGNKRTVIMFDSHGNAVVREKGEKERGESNEQKETYRFGATNRRDT